MIRIFTVVCFLLAVHPIVNAQLLVGAKGGLSLYNTSQEINNGMTKKLQSGFAGGLNLGYELGPNFNVMMDINLMPGGQSLTYKSDIIDGMRGKDGKVPVIDNGVPLEKGTSVTKEIISRYIQVPIYGQIYFEKAGKPYRYFINLGPYLGFAKKDSANLFAQQSNLPGQNADPRGPYKTENVARRIFDYGAAIGAGFQYKIEKAGFLTLELRYQLGLQDIFSPTKFQTNRYSSSPLLPVPTAQNRLFYASIGYIHPIKLKKKEDSWSGNTKDKKVKGDGKVKKSGGTRRRRS